MRDFFFRYAYKIKAYLHYRACKTHYHRYLLNAKLPNVSQPGEDQYKEKWAQLSKHIEPYSYRFFSHFCGHNADIVPEDIGNSVIERILNPPSHRNTYADKNMFGLIVGIDNIPKTIACRVNGSTLLDSMYNPIEFVNGVLVGGGVIGVDGGGGGYLSDIQEDAIILKPSVGSCSGRGIIKFERGSDGRFYSKGGVSLTEEYLMSYGNDFCLQACVKQSEFTSQFCSTSVNTIRIATYKSVRDDNVHVIGAIIRLGKAGSFVDNAHAGGVFVGIDITTGELGKYAINEFGEKFEEWNGIDLKNNTYSVPNWEKVLRFGEKVGNRVLHHRLLALDIALDIDNNPLLIEYNLGAFSYWLFMLTGHSPLGDYTDEIIDHCKRFKL